MYTFRVHVGAAVEFEWDEGKRRQGIAKLGVDMVHAALIFDGPVLTRVDDRADYGEPRLISLGAVAGEVFVVVHTPRDGRIRLITAWKAGRDDRDYYQTRIAGRDPADGGDG